MRVRRFWIVGPCGAGKSTVANELAARIGVTPTHLDDLFWKPGWVQSPDEELHERLAPVIAQQSWVIDGNYRRIRQCYTDSVELYVWLDVPLLVTLSRLVRRSVRRAFTRQQICNGNCESLRQTFLTQDSILYYGFRTHRRYHEEYAAELAGRRHVRLRTAKSVQAWLTQLDVAVSG